MDLAMCQTMLEVALDEARLGRAEGGIPIGAAIFTRAGELVSRGHNRRVQQSRSGDGDHPRPMLVLQRPRTPISLRYRGGWRKPYLPRRPGLAP